MTKTEAITKTNSYLEIIILKHSNITDRVALDIAIGELNELFSDEVEKEKHSKKEVER